MDIAFTTQAGTTVYAQLSLSKEHGHSMSLAVGSSHAELTPKEARLLGEELVTWAGIIVGSRRIMGARKAR